MNILVKNKCVTCFVGFVLSILGVSCVGNAKKGGNFAIHFADHTLREFDDYYVNYNHKNRIADWVVEHLTRDNLEKISTGKSNRLTYFAEDTLIDNPFRLHEKAYLAGYYEGTTRYDKGHMAACDIHQYDPTAMRSTFVTTNIAPQCGGCNRGSWKRLETKIQKAGVDEKDIKDLYIVTGPLFVADSKQIKYKVMSTYNMAVPTHFFKVAYFDRGNGKHELWSYIFPNSKEAKGVEPDTFKVDLIKIETLAGFKIFTEINRGTTSLNGKAPAKCD